MGQVLPGRESGCRLETLTFRWAVARRLLAVPAPGVAVLMNLEQAAHLHTGVNLSGRNGRVPQDLLDNAKVGSAGQHMCGEAVT